MASKRLKPTVYSSDDEDEVMETSAGEEEEHNSEEPSSEKDEPIKEKQQKTLTPPTVAAATETKRDKKKEKVCGGSGGALPSTKKRPNEGTSTEEDSAKRLKKDDEKPSIKRLEWSEEDEIRVLQGMIQFKVETGENPSLDKEGIYELVKEYISFDVNIQQLVDKMYSLKKKYVRKMRNGKKLSFSKPHHEKTFELSKLIWGSDVVKKPQKSSERIKKIEEDKKVMIYEGGDWFYKSFMAQSITSLGGDADFFKRGWNQVTVEKKKMLEDKWRLMLNNEFEVLEQKTKLVSEVVSAIVKASIH